ncbi:HCP-like protein [Gymnopus androsaceus JB14]|uniref:HCP-like protein n=1 Tax=Gymnopus androsaceus JB14 TaxID=1447944 RepID=A0A6A4GXI1_9AGAR|nr:HCP-like protein [Gymnopus androsaceus JB14]
MDPSRHANGLPPAPNYARSNEPLSPRRDPYFEADRNTISSYDESIASPDSFQSAQSWGAGYGQHPPHRNWTSPAAGYDPYLSAASNVLGMTPPPGQGQQYPPSHGSYNHNPQYHQFANSQVSLGSNHSGSHPASSSYHTPSVASFPTNSRATLPPISDTASEIEPRPSLARGESVLPSSVKSKAVDLTTPPYTKQYIDSYRQRIKGDPDPEAHFLYAKYLIDAARKIRTSSKDQRSAKKYSELLIGEALKVVRRLATQGDAYAEAQFFLANCYGTGALGLQVDHDRAYHLYLQAAKQNHAAASYRVAVCNEIGAGTRKEPPRAAAFYRKAASLGDTAAMYKLGMILLQGLLGEAKNPREAVGWLRRAAEQADEENPHALHELALLHEMPNSGLVPHDPLQAKNLYTQAAHLGYTQSQYKLGQCYEYGTLTCPVDPRRSIAWYTKAAEKGDPEAELALSGWYLTGSEGVLKQSDNEAYLWARRAANKGLSKAEYAVGYYAEVGIGINQDVEFAKRWYMRAAAQGNKRAMNRLTEMKRMGNKRMNIARPTRQQAKDECVIC